jgi:hypothetical protein
MSNRQRRRRRNQQSRRSAAPSRRKLALGAGLTVGATFAGAGNAQATNFPVTSLNDTGGTCTTSCTLRQALDSADLASHPNVGGNDTITFDSTLSGTIAPATPLPYIDEGVDIYGPSSHAVTIDGGLAVQIFRADIGATGYNSVEIDDLNLVHGNAPSGGALLNFDSNLVLGDMVISGSQANSGGAIWNGGTLALSGSTVTGNVADDQGGGIRNNGGYLYVEYSDISGNSADYGGGIYTNLGTTRVYGSTITGNPEGGGLYSSYTDTYILYSTLAGNHTDGNGGGLEATGYSNIEILNSTISGNDASGLGGGIDDNQGYPMTYTYSLDLTDSTVAGNYAVQGGGGISERTLANGGNEGYLPSLTNTIVADNTVLVGSDADLSGSLDASQSLIEHPGGATLTGGNNLLNVDPQLQALADNGGPTQTQAPLVSSPAIDAGESVSPHDQRDFDRPVDLPTITNTGPSGDGVDMGAVELQSLTDSQPSTGGGGGATTSPPPKCKGKSATVFRANGRKLTGTNKRDVIVGTSKKDKINARGGNDLVCAKGGNDTVKGGGGKDKLFGQGGKDTLLGQGGKDKLVGGGKNDTCVGGPGKDTEKSC